MKRTAAVILGFLALMALAAAKPADVPCGKGTRKAEPCIIPMAAQIVDAGTTVRLRWTITTTNADSSTVDVTGPTAVHRKYVVASKTDSVDYAKPAIGASIGGTLTGKSYRGTKSAAAPPVTWSYTEPDTLPPPPPTVKLEAFPTAWTLQPGQTLQFCGVFTRSDGSKYLASNSPVSACGQYVQS